MKNNKIHLWIGCLTSAIWLSTILPLLWTLPQKRFEYVLNDIHNTLNESPAWMLDMKNDENISYRDQMQKVLDKPDILKKEITSTWSLHLIIRILGLFSSFLLMTNKLIGYVLFPVISGIHILIIDFPELIKNEFLNNLHSISELISRMGIFLNNIPFLYLNIIVPIILIICILITIVLLFRKYLFSNKNNENAI